MHVMSSVLHPPPNESDRRRVNWDSLYGMNDCRAERADITLLRAASEALICLVSWPYTEDSFTERRSEPARSTRCIFDWYFDVDRYSVAITCDREDNSLYFVCPVFLDCSPSLISC